MYENETRNGTKQHKKDENNYKCSHISKAKTVKLIAFAISLCVNAHLIAIPMPGLASCDSVQMEVCSLYEVYVWFL